MCFLRDRDKIEPLYVLICLENCSSAKLRKNVENHTPDSQFPADAPLDIRTSMSAGNGIE